MLVSWVAENQHYFLRLFENLPYFFVHLNLHVIIWGHRNLYMVYPGKINANFHSNLTKAA